MSGISNWEESSTTIEVAARLLKYRDFAVKSGALLLFTYLDHCSYHIAGHVTAPQLGQRKN